MSLPHSVPASVVTSLDVGERIRLVGVLFDGDEAAGIPEFFAFAQPALDALVASGAPQSLIDDVTAKAYAARDAVRALVAAAGD